LARRRAQKQGITAAIIQKMKERAGKEPIVITRKKKEKPKASFRLRGCGGR
jgi:hypothetical protein